MDEAAALEIINAETEKYLDRMAVDVDRLIAAWLYECSEARRSTPQRARRKVKT